MRTHELIGLLASDAPRKSPWWRRAAVALLAGAGLSLALFAIILDVRSDLFAPGGASATLGKWVPAALILTLSGALALRLRRPEAAGSFVPLLIVLSIIAALALGADLMINGTADLGARALGSSAAACLAAISLLSLPPLAVLIGLLRAGAVTRPEQAGFASGLAAAGLAAAIYALHCNEDSPLFVVSWYGLAVLLVGVAGALLGRAALRW
jgi:hypothetical protein